MGIAIGSKVFRDEMLIGVAVSEQWKFLEPRSVCAEDGKALEKIWSSPGSARSEALIAQMVGHPSSCHATFPYSKVLSTRQLSIANGWEGA